MEHDCVIYIFGPTIAAHFRTEHHTFLSATAPLGKIYFASPYSQHQKEKILLFFIKTLKSFFAFVCHNDQHLQTLIMLLFFSTVHMYFHVDARRESANLNHFHILFSCP